MTEAEIEREVEARTDRLDAEYLTSPMTEAAYRAALDAIDAWAETAIKLPGYSIPTMIRFRQFEGRLMSGWRECCPVFPAVNLAATRDLVEIRRRYREADADYRRRVREWERENPL